MAKSKITRAAALMLAVCMLLSLPAFAATNSKDTQPVRKKSEEFVIYKGIFKGDGKGNYDMDGYTKRGDMAIMLCRAFGFEAGGDINFADVPTGSYYYDAIAALKARGIARGDGTNFMPEDYVTIEEAILFVGRSAPESGESKGSAEGLDSMYTSSSRKKTAPRRSLADMLYYILTGKEDYASDGGGSGAPKQLFYETDSDTPIYFSNEEFKDISYETTGTTFSYLKFTLPDAKSGKLYYGEEKKVSSSSKFYVDGVKTPSVSDVYFVPESIYTGTTSIIYSAYNSSGKLMYSTSAEIKITEGPSSLETLTFKTSKKKPVSLNGRYFRDVCRNKTGSFLSYINIKSSGSYGTLYYKGNVKVKQTDNYYADDGSSPAISDLTFVPGSSFSGTTAISFSAYGSSGELIYTDKFYVSVSSDEIIANPVSYFVGKNASVTFRGSDFIDVCRDLTGNTPNYVIFSSNSSGTLYYKDSKLKSSEKCYTSGSGSSLIDMVNFVPKPNFIGKASIMYKAYDSGGKLICSGTVEIAVQANSAAPEMIVMNTYKDTSITFDASRFRDVCMNTSGKGLGYVTFTLPPASCGVLYYKDTTKVTAKLKYYADENIEPAIADLCFTPKSGYSGSVLINYTAYRKDGTQLFTGILNIIVK